ncbi:hypothetical protein BC830DRAFT_1170496 [Chytriomyces sp. MP71]|nr:hypothetical protein BC830DRAFT_1170496 [Chytriomyces sp. MP71]
MSDNPGAVSALLRQVQDKYDEQLARVLELTAQVASLEREVGRLTRVSSALADELEARRGGTAAPGADAVLPHRLADRAASGWSPGGDADPANATLSAVSHTPPPVDSAPPRDLITLSDLKAERIALGIPLESTKCHIDTCQSKEFKTIHALNVHLGALHKEGVVIFSDGKAVRVYRGKSGQLQCPRCNKGLDRLDKMKAHCKTCDGESGTETDTGGASGSQLVGKGEESSRMTRVGSKSQLPADFKDASALLKDWDACAAQSTTPGPPDSILKCHLCNKGNENRKRLYDHYWSYHADWRKGSHLFRRGDNGNGTLTCLCEKFQHRNTVDFRRHISICKVAIEVLDVDISKMGGPSNSDGNEADLSAEDTEPSSKRVRPNESFTPAKDDLASYMHDDIGDLAASETRTTCEYGTFYNTLLRQLMPTYDSIASDSRKLVKQGVQLFLEETLEPDDFQAAIVRLGAANQGTFVIADTVASEFLDWIQPELERCFPGVQLVKHQEMISD